MKKKKAFTLLEIMIVIFLIGLIGSVIGYNMKGSLDKGKAFKTEQAINKIRDILELEAARGNIEMSALDQDQVAQYLKNSGIVRNPNKLLKDGWGNPMEVVVDDGIIKVTSVALSKYHDKIRDAGGIVDFEDDLEDEN